MILGLDISTSLGWALTSMSASGSVVLVRSGVVPLPTKTSPTIKLDRIRDVFAPELTANELLTQGSIAGVYVEAVEFVRYRDAHASYWRVRTLVEVVAAELGHFPVTEVSVGALKQWATGSGRASKADMCRAARDRFGVKLYARKDDEQKGTAGQEDQADAILVSAWSHS